MGRGKQPVGRLVGYARVSTEDQHLRMQEEALRSAGVLPENFHSDQKSGADTKRQGLSFALKDCRPGDTLVVWKLDRLTRSTAHLYDILKYLDEKGVGFRSLTEAIDTATPSGRLVMGVLAVIAQFERELIAQRTSTGIQTIKAKRARGEKWEWGRKLIMTEAKIKRAGKMLNSGKSGPEVAAALGVSTASIYPHWRRSKKGPRRFVRQYPKP
jgi:DNA invertase Pin-like site-specific DNA recombinase